MKILPSEWGIQRLIYTHQLPHEAGGGGYCRPTQIQSAKICPNFHFPGGGVGWGAGRELQTNIPEILECGHSRNFEQNICQLECGSASQIRVWRQKLFKPIRHKGQYGFKRT